MLKARIRKTGKMLDKIKKSIDKLDNSKVDVGYFSSQGKHTGRDGIADYSYVALAQAIELGHFPIQELYTTPMPFMDSIGDLTVEKMGTSSSVKRAFKAWGRKLHDNIQPTDLLNSIGKYAKLQSTKVFNNPEYFRQAPNNDTPVYETGEFSSHFAYRDSITKTVRT